MSDDAEWSRWRGSPWRQSPLHSSGDASRLRRITRLRRHGERYFADGLRELPDNRRLAILAVCAVEWELFLVDAGGAGAGTAGRGLHAAGQAVARRPDDSTLGGERAGGGGAALPAGAGLPRPALPGRCPWTHWPRPPVGLLTWRRIDDLGAETGGPATRELNNERDNPRPPPTGPAGRRTGVTNRQVSDSTDRRGISAGLRRQRLTTMLALLGLWVVPTCGGGPSSPSAAWTCDVTLTLVPSTFGSLSSPSGVGRGTGTGSTRDEAQSSAYGQACGQLNLDSATAALCRAGDDFRVGGGGSGNIHLFSAVQRSVSCRS